MRFKDNGFSLIEILISMGVLSIVLMGFMEFRRMSIDSEVKSTGHIDYVQLNSEFLTLIDRDENCTASLANPDTAGVVAPLANRVTFKASELEGSTPLVNLEIELWTGTMDSLRRRKRLAAQEMFGSIEITSVRLYLPDHNTGDLAGTNPYGLQAEIILEGTRRVSATERQAITPLRKLVLINVENDGSGNSSIRGCGGIHAI